MYGLIHVEFRGFVSALSAAQLSVFTVGAKRFHGDVPVKLSVSGIHVTPFREQHGMRREHPQQFVRQHCVVKRRVHVPAHDEGIVGVSSIGDEDHGG